MLVVDLVFLEHRGEMLFEVTPRVTVALGEDGVTPEETADGFRSEWASLPLPMPQARAILLARLHSSGYGLREHAPFGILRDRSTFSTLGCFYGVSIGPSTG